MKSSPTDGLWLSREGAVDLVWAHDSVGVGEDGPAYQPIEHVASLWAIPNLDELCPADTNETSVAWGEILRRTDRPAV